jgi:hypothetical protein
MAYKGHRRRPGSGRAIVTATGPLVGWRVPGRGVPPSLSVQDRQLRAAWQRSAGRGVVQRLEAVASVGHDEQVSVRASQDSAPEIMRSRPCSTCTVASPGFVLREAGAFGGVPATGAGVPVDLLPGQGCERGLLHAVTVPVRPPPATGAPGWHGPAFPKIRRAYVTVPEYGRAVVDVSGSAATPRVLRASRIIC